MSGNTAIEWADTVWNPVTGCTRVSAGCDHCYAFALHDARYLAWKDGRMPNAPAQYHQPFSKVQLLPARLTDPIRWTRPRKVFVNSMGDLFHQDVPDKFIAQVFGAMAVAEKHTFQLLTKRPERMRQLCSDPEWVEGVAYYATVYDPKEQSKAVQALPTFPWPLPNVWLGTSTEDQRTFDERVPYLLQTPAAVRFLSIEPLLGPIDLNPAFGLREGHQWNSCLCDEIDPTDRPCIVCDARHQFGYSSGLGWVIVGGESGEHARPMHPGWVRSIRDACVGAGVPFFFKQWGEWKPIKDNGQADGEITRFDERNKLDFVAVANARTALHKVGKKAAGRTLDGRTWDQFPGGGG